jgi:DNA-directed RNA polymerase specialized sigma24 family protein
LLVRKFIPKGDPGLGGGKMTIGTINTSEDHSRYIGQVYQEQYARLQRYFLIQLGDSSEADDCVQETIRRLFFFMEDRNWEAEAEYIPVYLMRIAGLLCSRKLAEKRSQRAASLSNNENNSLFVKIKIEMIKALKERVEFKQSIRRQAVGTLGQP